MQWQWRIFNAHTMWKEMFSVAATGEQTSGRAHTRASDRRCVWLCAYFCNEMGKIDSCKKKSSRRKVATAWRTREINNIYLGQTLKYANIEYTHAWMYLFSQFVGFVFILSSTAMHFLFCIHFHIFVVFVLFLAKNSKTDINQNNRCYRKNFFFCLECGMTQREQTRNKNVSIAKCLSVFCVRQNVFFR